MKIRRENLQQLSFSFFTIILIIKVNEYRISMETIQETSLKQKQKSLNE
jgi:hypothetical protein